MPRVLVLGGQEIFGFGLTERRLFLSLSVFHLTSVYFSCVLNREKNTTPARSTTGDAAGCIK